MLCPEPNESFNAVQVTLRTAQVKMLRATSPVEDLIACIKGGLWKVRAGKRCIEEMMFDCLVNGA